MSNAWKKSDADLLRKLLNAHSKTATEAMFLELAIYPLKYTLAVRRFMYLWHILSRDTSELIRKIYDAQKCNVNKGDWVQIMQEERKKYGLVESDETIAKMSQEKYRNLVKKKVFSHAVEYLHAVASPHSKSDNLKNESFQRQAYFSDRRLSKDDIQLLFKLRTKMLDCKANFRNQYRNILTCRICKATDSIEDEDHILNCSVLNEEEYEVQFANVYGSTDEQYRAVQVFKKVLRRRQIYIDIAEKTANAVPSV
jgi:hypothetical protein